MGRAPGGLSLRQAGGGSSTSLSLEQTATPGALVRCVAFAEASLNFNMSATYISTKSNHLADDLSRDRVHTFLSKVPQASPTPSPTPMGLMDLLLNPAADWIGNHWRQAFHAIFKTA